MKIQFESKEEVIQYLSETCTYIKRNNLGKIFFRSVAKKSLSQELKLIILSIVKDYNQEELSQMNQEIKSNYSVLHPYTPINKWLECSRPREIMKEIGPENMSNDQLLTILISTGKPGISAQTLAQNLLKNHPTFREIAQLSIKGLCTIDGIGLAKAAQIKAALEIAKRLSLEQVKKNLKLKQPEEVLEYVSSHIGLELQDSKKEHLYVILMDNKMKPVFLFKSTTGSIDTNVVDLQEIIRKISEYGATSLVLVHNHPSGETQPSQEDEETTRRIAKTCNLIGVKLVDHVIVGTNPEGYFSFHKNGLL